ncbi:amidohydrolase family protein [Streptomyces sp. NPDC048277]|uniref:amidohydrolase family protein n=1 Tax=Streptomyces sp. NPDC048277 TaxID=3155027 RepID=UPI0033C09114
MPKITLANVRVCDGAAIGPRSAITIDDGLITDDPSRAQTFDAQGATLIPGLIDAHVHVNTPAEQAQLRSHGITTGLVMASWPPAVVDGLRNLPGATDLRTAGLPAVGPGGGHAKIPGFPAEGIISEPEEARKFVAERVAEGVDYIKVVTERPGTGNIEQPTLDALVAAAHQHGKRVVAHAVAAEAYEMAVEAGVDVLTHVPLDRPLSPETVARMARGNHIVVPTLIMMKRVCENANGAGGDYGAARASVSAMHAAGIPVLAGTDANVGPGPAVIPHGSSLHDELELLVEAGLTPLAALRAATSVPARCFDLNDRGAIRPGMRADLVLIDGDPRDDIRAVRRIVSVWCAGDKHHVAV